MAVMVRQERVDVHTRAFMENLKEKGVPVQSVHHEQNIMTGNYHITVLFDNNLRLRFQIFNERIDDVLGWLGLVDRVADSYDTELEKELERLEEEADKKKPPEPIKEVKRVERISDKELYQYMKDEYYRTALDKLAEREYKSQQNRSK